MAIDWTETLISQIYVLIVLVVWLSPIVMIARSERVGSAEKLAWILAVLLISWFAWLGFYLLAPIKPRAAPR